MAGAQTEKDTQPFWPLFDHIPYTVWRIHTLFTNYGHAVTCVTDHTRPDYAHATNTGHSPISPNSAALSLTTGLARPFRQQHAWPASGGGTAHGRHAARVARRAHVCHVGLARWASSCGRCRAVPVAGERIPPHNLGTNTINHYSISYQLSNSPLQHIPPSSNPLVRLYGAAGPRTEREHTLRRAPSCVACVHSTKCHILFCLARL